MAPVVPPDPQSAADYDDRTTAAVKSVLLEIGQILGSFKGAAIPWAEAHDSVREELAMSRVRRDRPTLLYLLDPSRLRLRLPR
ncbi:hypothetical protein NKH94_29670 [Mesorhizobium australicum]|uniref:hypothetical protein n=1 Tax=Mesorhizobium australicum TaxID=536018 RepID=UPI003336F044